MGYAQPGAGTVPKDRFPCPAFEITPKPAVYSAQVARLGKPDERFCCRAVLYLQTAAARFVPPLAGDGARVF